MVGDMPTVGSLWRERERLMERVRVVAVDSADNHGARCVAFERLGDGQAARTLRVHAHRWHDHFIAVSE